MIGEASFHGSDVEKVAGLYGIDPERLILFSANVSPMGVSGKYTEGIKDRLDCVERYPDRDYTALREAIAGYCSVSPEAITVGGGSSELIGAVIRHKPKPAALIVAPAYAEYERNVLLSGGRTVHHYLKEENGFEFDTDALIERIDESIDILIICNPVNPVSTALTREETERILKKCREKNVILVMDETYIDFADEGFDASPLTGDYGELFVIRSMSKFFCAPGLRIGYGITSDRELLKEIEGNKDPWSVSSLSNEAAILMLSDRDYIGRAKRYMKDERERVCGKLDGLKEKGIRYYRPRANFVLLKLPEGGPTSHGLFEKAVRNGMLIRDCADFDGLGDRFIRFCFMKKEDDDRLLSLIGEAIGEAYN
ncbi:MAG: aminotransferase class I/II-fold pyridoxal phosphate-dependent enzyme [Lachnospiraceae bacterium]|nr:aminotransferase class I/II-fold pyridoxal phosphate-dependent enzyme [Lachnospiraceae bacterium]